MKKRKLKSLSLNKKSISKLQLSVASGIKGGESLPCIPIDWNAGSYLDDYGCNSERGCYGGVDETMSCPDMSCACVDEVVITG